MGRVLEATDPELRRSVAVKVMREPDRVGDQVWQRFVSEAQITAQLEHPNIVPVYDMGRTPAGEPYFVMRKVGGNSLAEVLRGLRHGTGTGEWGRQRLLSAFVQVCNAVAFAHSRGVLHRDIKPSNIMLGSYGEVLLLDWGVARLQGRTHGEIPSEVDSHTVGATAYGTAVGTPGYMSPEQVSGEPAAVDERTDVWSLGAVLYEILTHQPAYRGPNAFMVVAESVKGLPQDPREVAPSHGIPPEIAAICLRALAPSPADRYPGALELASAVLDFQEGTQRLREAVSFLEEASTARGELESTRSSWVAASERIASLASEGSLEPAAFVAITRKNNVSSSSPFATDAVVPATSAATVSHAAPLASGSAHDSVSSEPVVW